MVYALQSYFQGSITFHFFYFSNVFLRIQNKFLSIFFRYLIQDMTIAKIALLVLFISFTVIAQQTSAHLTEQHLAIQAEHFASGKRSSLDRDTPIKVGGKNSSIAGKPKIAPKPTGKSNTQAPNAIKPPAAAGKPKNPAQVAKPPATTQQKGQSPKGSSPRKLVPLKPSTVQTKPDQKVPVTNGKQRVKGTPAAPKKIVKKVLVSAFPDNCFNSIDKAGLQKLQVYLPNKVRGKVSCKNRLTCFLGENQLQRYLEAISTDPKCKCAKTAKNNEVVKCQAKALTGFDLDDNPMHIYYRFGKDGKFTLNEIKAVTVQFKAGGRKGKGKKSEVSWAVSAAYPAEP